MATNYFHGLEFRWSVNGVTFNGTGTAQLIQNASVQNQISVYTAMNNLGNEAIFAGHNKKREATVTIIPALNTTSDGNLAISSFEPDPGVMISISDTLDSNSIMNGTNWIVLGIDESRVVDKAAEFTARVTLIPAITS